MLIPKFPETFTHKLRTIIFGIATIVSIIVVIILSNFMSDSIVQTILWIVFSILTALLLAFTVYSAVRAFVFKE